MPIVFSLQQIVTFRAKLNTTAVARMGGFTLMGGSDTSIHKNITSICSRKFAKIDDLLMHRLMNSMWQST